MPAPPQNTTSLKTNECHLKRDYLNTVDGRNPAPADILQIYNRPMDPMGNNTSIIDPQKKHTLLLSMKYWLVNRDPSNGLL